MMKAALCDCSFEYEKTFVRVVLDVYNRCYIKYLLYRL
jgi:hypothetical protein